jgi:hypothetical protein
MASLKIKTGAKREVKSGRVEIEGACVVLREKTEKTERVVFAYCLMPGETITKGEGDDYIVEF